MAPSLSATEEEGAKPVGSGGVDIAVAKEQPRSFLKATLKDLTEEQVLSPAGVRWLQYEADRLEQECGTTRSELVDLKKEFNAISASYHDQRVEIETLKGTRGLSIRNELLSNLSLAAGSAGLGAAPGLFAVPDATNFAHVALTVSGVLFVGGILCRYWR